MKLDVEIDRIFHVLEGGVWFLLKESQLLSLGYMFLQHITVDIDVLKSPRLCLNHSLV